MLETIQIKKYTTGTTITTFVGTDSGQTASDVFSWLKTDQIGTPIDILFNEFDTKFSRNQNNDFVPNYQFNYYTGLTTIQKLNQVLSTEKQGLIRQSFINNVHSSFGDDIKAWMKFEVGPIDDLNASVSLVRTIDTLNTLSVHNSVIGSQPVKESPTGVVFGKLSARQKIKDENGNQVIIPLKNVVVGIFNTSTNFPEISSTDEQGDRIRLNLLENSKPYMYFNPQSYNTDKEFLKDGSQINFIPNEYKYTTITNENGEFVLYDVPVGDQVFMLEVDLLKQGLTKDEVALNYFPYPATEQPNVDTVPHYYFQQFSIGVVPSWGDFQTGYTQLDVIVPLDLRKWTTYFSTPISYVKNSIEQRVNKGHQTPITFKIRDMSRVGFPNANILEIVEVEDVYQKISGQTLMWQNEFKAQKNKAEFRRNLYSAFKLPANLYDPNGIGTFGNKGVWLSAYQFRMFYNAESLVYRDTGFGYDLVGANKIKKSHYNLNRNSDNSDLNNPIGVIGVFPYEKPWTINYPEPYSIPKIPVIKNTNKSFKSDGSPINIIEPKWLDGDRVGGIYSYLETSGFGLQFRVSEYITNLFSKNVTSDFVYKYEKGVSWSEQYVNGFVPYFDSTSNVEGGEKYQRLEAGYGYWLRPEGMPRISNNQWGDAIHTPDMNNGNNYVLDDQFTIGVVMDSRQPIGKGALDIYRVFDASKVLEPSVPFNPKFAYLILESIYRQVGNGNDSIQFLVNGDGDGLFRVDQSTSVDSTLSITNNGEIPVTIEGQKLEIGQTLEVHGQIYSGNVIKFPTNSSYNNDDNSYNSTLYFIKFKMTLANNDFFEFGMDFNVGAGFNDVISTSYNHVKTYYKVDGNQHTITTSELRHHDVYIRGICFLHNNQGGSYYAGVQLGGVSYNASTDKRPNTNDNIDVYDPSVAS